MRSPSDVLPNISTFTDSPSDKNMLESFMSLPKTSKLIDPAVPIAQADGARSNSTAAKIIAILKSSPPI